ncbi:MAG: amino acid ABC transporter substrate-binding protein [Candidatus Rokubacteria bacterium]|nr:amino acid ABC transporter substrate-binding protein [Candidatus Rokubacteria bacterium]
MRKMTMAVGLGLLFGSLGMVLPVAWAAEEEIRIGAVWGLTGPQAGVSQEGRRGMEMAQDLLNKKGVLGRKIRVIFEDDKADPAVAVSAAEKLITQDKVVAFVGGVGSTICNAMLGAFEKYTPKPLGTLTGCGATTIEQRFGKERGYFFVHPWEYYYQTTMRDFLLSVTPRPQTVFIAHEDRLYGTSHSKMAEEYFKEAGFKVVARESFKSGAPDLTPLLTRAKAMNPDVFYWIAYGADAVLVTKQGKELNFNPRMYASTVQLGTQEYRDAVGKGNAETFVGITVWEPIAAFPASKEWPEVFPSTRDWVRDYTTRFKREPHYYSIMSYVALVATAKGIEAAGSLERDRVLGAMEKINTMTPMGPLKFSPSKFAVNHAFKQMMIFQWQKGEKVLVFPRDVASGMLMHPFPAWTQR